MKKTTTKAAPSRRPWRLGRSSRRADYSYSYITAANKTRVATIDRTEMDGFSARLHPNVAELDANAELIVRAVNSHEALLEGAKKLITELNYDGRQEPESVIAAKLNLLNAVRNAQAETDQAGA